MPDRSDVICWGQIANGFPWVQQAIGRRAGFPYAAPTLLEGSVTVGWFSGLAR